MLNLENKIKLAAAVVNSPNLVDRFTAADLAAIGRFVVDGYKQDKWSRRRWEKRTEAAMDLALQVQKEKTFPWPGCSNVAFPLITIATLQFHSRAYPALVSGPLVAKARVIGEATAEAQARSVRVSTHMSYQVLEEDTAWEEQHDRLLIIVPIVGCAFTKTYRQQRAARTVSELVTAQDLVLDYYAKSVEECQRKTQIILMTRNEIYERAVSGVYLDVRKDSWFASPAQVQTTPGQTRKDTRTGMEQPSPSMDTPFTVLEQHCLLDLDGDGYAEPYIVTVEESSGAVLRIVTRFDSMSAVQKNARGEIFRIEALEYFTKYEFIPSPDGSIYGLGFGVLLGPLNESTNTLVNQLLDAGTMVTAGGGFLGRGAKIRGGTYTFAPLEWKRVDSSGDDLRKNIMPLPVREPSAVLFQLLALLIEYTGRISGTTETIVGENPGQNTPAGTTQTMVEQGMKVYSAIFKRLWRGMKGEFKKRYVLNGVYLPSASLYGAAGSQVFREDYLGDPETVVPAADPNMTSDQMTFQRAVALKSAAMSTPGYDAGYVERKYLEALHVVDIDKVYPGVDPNAKPGPSEKVQIAMMQMQLQQQQLEFNKVKFVMEMQEDIRVNTAKILELQATASKTMEEAGSVKDGQRIAAFSAAIGAMKTHNDMLISRVTAMMKGMENGSKIGQSTLSDGGGLPELEAPSGDAAGAGAVGGEG